MKTKVSFEKPPLAEALLGVQFPPLVNFTAGHCGWFWKEYLGKEWPKVSDAPPLPPQTELFGEARWSAGPQPLILLQNMLVPGAFQGRFQIHNVSGDRVVQVQNTRFIYNWQKQASPYPGHKDFLQEFAAKYAQFSNFVGDAGLGLATPNQWEVAYINHIQKGTLWQSPSEWHKLFPKLVGEGRTVAGGSFEGVGEWTYVLNDQQGRLHITLQHARTGPSMENEVVQMQLTARGPVLESEGHGLMDGLKLGHDVIIQAFAELTTPEAQRLWGRRS
jgi:uncharacterized protein (TIGR04255 family)